MAQHRQRKMQYLERYQAMVQAGTDSALVCLAEAIRMPPHLVARLVLEALYVFVHREAGEADDAAQGAGGQRSKKSEPMVKKWLQGEAMEQLDPAHTGIPVETLRADVRVCGECDDSFGPLVDRVRKAVGLEYEYILHEQLHNLDIPFMTEDMMRVASLAKTPDVVLKVPIELHGMLIYWIESKACFADADTMKTQYHDQFSAYTRRIGPGLVVYWFGFLDDLVDPTSQLPLLELWRQRGVLVLDHAPETVIVRNDLPPTPLHTWRDSDVGLLPES